MADDFFADLLPLKAKKAQTEAIENDEEVRGSGSQYAEKKSVPHSKSSVQEVGDLLGNDTRDEIPADFASGSGSQAPTTNHAQETAQLEAVVQKALQKFAVALKPVLASITSQVEELGSKVDKVTTMLHTSQTSAKQNEAILEHLATLENGMTDLNKTIKHLKEHQDGAKASQEGKNNEGALKVAVPTVPETKAAVAEAPSPAASLISNPSAVLPPGPSLPLPTVPPLPATAPPATPAELPPVQPHSTAPVEAAKTLQQYGASQPQFAFAPPSQQQQASLPQGPPQSVFSSAPQQQQAQPPTPPQYNAPSPNQPNVGTQQGYPSQHQPPPAPPTPPYSGQPPPLTQFPNPQPQSRPSYQPYTGSYSQQAPRPYYSQNTPSQDTSPYSGSYAAPSTGQTYGSQSSGGYPSLPPSSRYGGSTPGQQSHGLPPPPRSFSSQSYGSSRPEPPRQPGPPSAQNVPLEKVVDDIANMGFSRHEARDVIRELQDRGQAIDLNVVLDRLMNGPRR